MAWIKLDENFADHPKIAQLDPSSGWLWVCALAYCNRHRTDGRIPVAMLSRISSVSVASRSAKRLEAVGLWSRVGHEFVVHDYLDYQPSAAELYEKSKKRSDAGRRGGQAKAKQVASTVHKPVPARPVYTEPDPTRENKHPQPVKISSGATAEQRAQILSVFHAWQKHHPGHFMTPHNGLIEWRELERRIVADAIPVEVILEAVEGIQRDTWEGRKAQLTLKNVVKSADAIYRLAAMPAADDGPKLSDQTKRTVAAAQSWIAARKAKRDAAE